MTDHSHDHDHDSGHDHSPGHDHDTALDGVEVAVVTISSSRTLSDDPAGDAVADAIEATAATVDRREVVGDDREAIGRAVDECAAGEIDAVVTTGGTGLTPDDVTIEAATERFDKEIPGFGEFFRRRSEAEVGTAAMLSRATAGVVEETAVFCLPGSENAATTGVEDVILPELGHVVHLAQR